MSELAPVADAALASEAQMRAAALRPLAFAELAIEREGALPRDLPRRPPDAISLGARGRAILAKLRPFVAGVLTFGDHRVRTLAIGPRRLSIDASGSYRLE